MAGSEGTSTPDPEADCRLREPAIVEPQSCSGGSLRSPKWSGHWFCLEKQVISRAANLGDLGIGLSACICAMRTEKLVSERAMYFTRLNRGRSSASSSRRKTISASRRSSSRSCSAGGRRIAEAVPPSLHRSRTPDGRAPRSPANVSRAARASLKPNWADGRDHDWQSQSGYRGVFRDIRANIVLPRGCGALTKKWRASSTIRR